MMYTLCIYLPIFVGKRPRFPWQILPILHSTPRHIWIAQRLPSVLPDATGPCHPGDPIYLCHETQGNTNKRQNQVMNLMNHHSLDVFLPVWGYTPFQTQPSGESQAPSPIPALLQETTNVSTSPRASSPWDAKNANTKYLAISMGCARLHMYLCIHIYIYTHIMCIYVYYVYT